MVSHSLHQIGRALQTGEEPGVRRSAWGVFFSPLFLGSGGGFYGLHKCEFLQKKPDSPCPDIVVSLSIALSILGASGGITAAVYLYDKVRRGQMHREYIELRDQEQTENEDLINKISNEPLSEALYQEFQGKELTRFQKEVCFRALLKKQFQLDEIQADGNCLFRACSGDHVSLRKDAVAYMRAHSSDFEHFLEDLETHLVKMGKDMEWGGNPEISAISKVLNCPIAVYSKDYPVEFKEGKLWPLSENIFNGEGDIFSNPNTVFLYYSGGNHYTKLIRR